MTCALVSRKERLPKAAERVLALLGRGLYSW
jgi:hypothetical protein